MAPPLTDVNCCLHHNTLVLNNLCKLEKNCFWPAVTESYRQWAAVDAVADPHAEDRAGAVAPRGSGLPHPAVDGAVAAAPRCCHGG